MRQLGNNGEKGDLPLICAITLMHKTSRQCKISFIPLWFFVVYCQASKAPPTPYKFGLLSGEQPTHPLPVISFCRHMWRRGKDCFGLLRQWEGGRRDPKRNCYAIVSTLHFESVCVCVCMHVCVSLVCVLQGSYVPLVMAGGCDVISHWHRMWTHQSLGGEQFCLEE